MSIKKKKAINHKENSFFIGINVNVIYTIYTHKDNWEEKNISNMYPRYYLNFNLDYNQNIKNTQKSKY